MASGSSAAWTVVAASTMHASTANAARAERKIKSPVLLAEDYQKKVRAGETST
jgi:hypothetical protein